MAGTSYGKRDMSLTAGDQSFTGERHRRSRPADAHRRAARVRPGLTSRMPPVNSGRFDSCGRMIFRFIAACSSKDCRPAYAFLVTWAFQDCR